MERRTKNMKEALWVALVYFIIFSGFFTLAGVIGWIDEKYLHLLEKIDKWYYKD